MKTKMSLLERIIESSKLRKGDPVFVRLSKGCPGKKNYFEKDVGNRCVINSEVCLPKNCILYHWFKGGEK